MNTEYTSLRRLPSAQTDTAGGARAGTARTTQLTAIAAALNRTPRALTLRATAAALNTARPGHGRPVMQRMMEEDEQPAAAAENNGPMTAAQMEAALIGDVAADTEEDHAYILEVFNSVDWMRGHLAELAASDMTRAEFDTEERAGLVRELLGALRAFEQAAANAPGAGGGSSSWARNSTRSRAADLAAHGNPALFQGGRYTIHHKVSQSRLKTLSATLEAAGQGPRFSALVNPDGAGASLEKGLLNLPANLEVGPRGETRGDDPGAEFDPNVAADGSMTPRSADLSAVDGFITAGHTDWNALYAILARHAGQPQITPPKEAQWRLVKGKWHRGPAP